MRAVSQRVETSPTLGALLCTLSGAGRGVGRLYTPRSVSRASSRAVVE